MSGRSNSSQKCESDHNDHADTDPLRRHMQQEGAHGEADDQHDKTDDI